MEDAAPTMSHTVPRREKIQRRLRRDGLDAMLVTHPVNVSYLTDFTGEDSYLLVTRHEAILISDFRFKQQIAEECGGVEVTIRRKRSLPDAAARLVRRAKVRRLAFETRHLSVAAHTGLAKHLPRVELVGWVDAVESLRVVKDAHEVRQIEEAVGFAEKALAMLRLTISADDTEKHVADLMETFLRQAGARASGFPTIAAVGPRAALPHCPPGSVRLGEHGFLLLDWGASGRLYKSDLTRMLIGSRISPKFGAIYRTVLKAQQRAIKTIRPGVCAGEVDAEARRTIGNAGFGRFFGHALGHGVGLEVHEAPSLRQGSDEPLRRGMVVTVEPGIYLPGWGGIRIEDDVLVTAGGHRVLSSVGRTLASAQL